MKNSHQDGFTLIELSIVLVIIGLVIGGVLVGRDLIEAAQMRAAISQVEKVKTAVNTFRGKYNGFPGDYLSAKAAQMGMVTRTGAIGHGDGNALVEGCSAGALLAGCENVLFWGDLSFANLIDGSFTAATDNLMSVTWRARALQEIYAALENLSFIADAQATPVAIKRYQIFPTSVIGNDNYMTVFSATGVNYLEIAGIISTNSGAYTLANRITPQQAFTIDKKVDDGLPLYGDIIAAESTAVLNTVATPGASTCVYDDGSNYPYNTTTMALAAMPLCQIITNF